MEEHMCNQINKEFDDFQEYLKKEEKKEKYFIPIEVNDDFYKLIDDITGSELSNEAGRRNKNTKG